jgi:hypothetical protein
MFSLKRKNHIDNSDLNIEATDDNYSYDMPYDNELWTIEYLRGLDKKDYDKLIKKVEIYRKADEDVAKLDTKKAAKRAQELLETEFVES